MIWFKSLQRYTSYVLVCLSICLFTFSNGSFNAFAANSGVYFVEDNYVSFDYKQYSDKPEESIYYFLYDLKYSGSEITEDNILAKSLRENYDYMLLFKNGDVLRLGFVSEPVYWNEEKGGLVANGTASGCFGDLDYYLDNELIYISNSPTHVFGTYSDLGQNMEFVASAYDIYGNTSNSLIEKETDLKTSYLYKPRFKTILEGFTVEPQSILNVFTLGISVCSIFVFFWFIVKKVTRMITTVAKSGKLKV